MIEVRKYTSDQKEKWDQLIKISRADTFLFYRDYMDYHSDRFKDHSLLIYRKGKLEGVLPGNLNGTTFYSHQGLTYGGLVTTEKITGTDTLKIFQLISNELKNQGIETVIYKPLPFIYQKIPSQEDIYALFRLGAEKTECNISSTIYQNNRIPFPESRKSGIRKSKISGVKVETSEDFEMFWPILHSNLNNKHGRTPVHNVSEIKLLKSLFPENIGLYIATLRSEVLAGCVLFIMKNIVHVQYMACSLEGKQIGALDILLNELINKHFLATPIFDFGHSNENMGTHLNENLIFQKEGFGGRGVVYESYRFML
jgi:hypothetical protein